MTFLRKLSRVLVVLLFASLAVPGFASIPWAEASTDFDRSVSLPVKVVLIGFNEQQVDTTYLSWSGYDKNLPSSITNVALESGNSTGVVFRPKYSFSFASSSLKESLVSYLGTIGRKVHGKNPWFGQYQIDKQNKGYYVSVPIAIDYVVYDANSVEDWLWAHGQDIGGYPEDGWTIIIVNLPELPSVSWADVQTFKRSNGDQLPKSMPHYYGISHTDVDLGYKSRYRDFMNAWGGHHRLWFIDLSAGPVFNSEWEDLPLQVVLGDNKLDVSSTFGKKWITEYLADYIWQATLNFIAPQFVYYPQYSPNYQIDVFILDDRDPAEKGIIPIQGTVNKDMVASAFRDLVPYSTVTVNLSFPKVTQQLHELIRSHYKYTDSWIQGNIFASPERYGVVDLRPIYQYMLENMASFDPKAHMGPDTITIPVFAFALSGETYFTYTYKWSIGKTDWETGALLGIALKECVFISYNQWEFTRGDQVDPPQPGKGEGFTQTIIHEVGHEFGLMHPHEYGDIGDFIFSPMGYFTDDYKFGQIDKDAIQRAHVDQVYMVTQLFLAEAGGNPEVTGLVSQARDKLAEVDSAYSRMEYGNAFEPALEAYSLAKQASPRSVVPQETEGQLGDTLNKTRSELAEAKSQIPMYFIAGLAAGLVAAMAIFLFIRRQLPHSRRLGGKMVWKEIRSRDLMWAAPQGTRSRR
jgi:hypothetical protein